MDFFPSAFLLSKKVCGSTRPLPHGPTATLTFMINKGTDAKQEFECFVESGRAIIFQLMICIWSY